MDLYRLIDHPEHDLRIIEFCHGCFIDKVAVVVGQEVGILEEKRDASIDIALSNS